MAGIFYRTSQGVVKVTEDISGRDKGFKSARAVAEDYKQRGWKAIPGNSRSQHPNAKSWSTRDFDVEEFSSSTRVGPQNIFVQMGRPSNGLTDIDLDCPTAHKLAPDFLPKTEAIFGGQIHTGVALALHH